VTEERRNFARIDFQGQAVLRGDDDTQGACKLLNVSLRGVQLSHPENIVVHVDSIYQLEIPLGEAASISMSIRVMRVDDDRFGARWERIDVDSLTHLRRLVELNLGDPTELDDELARL